MVRFPLHAQMTSNNDIDIAEQKESALDDVDKAQYRAEVSLKSQDAALPLCRTKGWAQLKFYLKDRNEVMLRPTFFASLCLSLRQYCMCKAVTVLGYYIKVYLYVGLLCGKIKIPTPPIFKKISNLSFDETVQLLDSWNRAIRQQLTKQLKSIKRPVSATTPLFSTMPSATEGSENHDGSIVKSVGVKRQITMEIDSHKTNIVSEPAKCLELMLVALNDKRFLHFRLL